ncbi:MAG: T9SS type A sorting domain-containing protein [Fimbriimonadaceae bacterium]|nr:T9SS type A sorting domain-containing protein [Chitinophagales bacterium]
MKRYLLIISVLIITNYLHAQVTVVSSPIYMYNCLCVVNDKLLFFATDEIDNDYELWSSDGTDAGTQLIKDIYPGTDGSILSNAYWGYSDKQPVVFNNELYFLATDELHGMEIWKSDGTADGTVLLKDINPGANGFFYPEFNYPYFTEIDGILYFAANNGIHGFELWKTDGTETGTEMVADISADGLYGSNPEHLINFKGTLYFTARDDVYGYEIYKSDGTEAGTEIIKDIIPGINGAMNDGYAGSIDPIFKVSGDYLYFVGRIDASLPIYYYLYRTDGTDAGTITLNNDLQNITDLTDVNGTCFLYAFDGDYDHSGLWKTDGSVAGTQNIITDHIQAYNAFYNFNNTLFFNGGSDTYDPLGLFKSDGTTSGTALVKDFEGLASFPSVSDYVAEDGSNSFFYRALFKITESSMDYRFVQTNGTTAGTKIFWGAAPFRGSAFFDGKLYFPGIDTTGAEIWTLFSIIPETFETGVNEFTSQNFINVSPNPASDNITIKIPDAINNGILKIYNMQGNIIYSEILKNSSAISINTTSWPNGIYFTGMESDKSVSAREIIIEH